MFHLIVSADITLRTYEEEDSAELFMMVDKNRAHLRPWLLWVDGTLKESHSLEYIKAAKQEQYQQQSMALGIFKGGQLIGGIGMRQWDQKLKKAQIGYWLIKKEEGKGILQQCANVFIQYLFTTLKLNKVELQYLPSNKRSEATAKRLGFVTEGILRDCFLMNGMLCDVVYSGLLYREWQSTTRE